jgi:hypothetical protein
MAPIGALDLLLPVEVEVEDEEVLDAVPDPELDGLVLVEPDPPVVLVDMGPKLNVVAPAIVARYYQFLAPKNDL